MLVAAAATLLIPLWAVFASGLVQVRACVPALGTLGEAHLMFLRPAVDCPSGSALDESGVLAIVGTVTLTALAGQLAALGALTGLGAVASAAAAVVLALVGGALPALRSSRAIMVARKRASLTWATALVGMVGRRASSVVGLRAPPLPA